MADISTELQAINNAKFGREVRYSIYQAIDKINKNVNTATATANSAKSVADTAYYDQSPQIYTPGTDIADRVYFEEYDHGSGESGDLYFKLTDLHITVPGRTTPVTATITMDSIASRMGQELAITPAGVANCLLMPNDKTLVWNTATETIDLIDKYGAITPKMIPLFTAKYGRAEIHYAPLLKSWISTLDKARENTYIYLNGNDGEFYIEENYASGYDVYMYLDNIAVRMPGQDWAPGTSGTVVRYAKTTPGGTPGIEEDLGVSGTTATSPKGHTDCWIIPNDTVLAYNMCTKKFEFVGQHDVKHTHFVLGVRKWGRFEITYAPLLQQYEARNAATVNVRDFGAIGDGVHDDAPAIQKAIDQARWTGAEVFFPTGTYYLNTPCSYDQGFALVCFSGQRLRGAGAVLMPGPRSGIKIEDGREVSNPHTIGTYPDSASSRLGGYDDCQDIIIEGFVFDGRRAGSNNWYNITHISTSHARDIIIRNCMFQKGGLWHEIEINSSSRVEVYGCRFNVKNTEWNADGLTESQKQARLRSVYQQESIQIDAAVGAGNFAPSDGTVCAYIDIHDNLFVTDANPCVGNHTDAAHYEIAIHDNFFMTGSDPYFVQQREIPKKNPEDTQEPQLYRYSAMIDFTQKVRQVTIKGNEIRSGFKTNSRNPEELCECVLYHDPKLWEDEQNPVNPANPAAKDWIVNNRIVGFVRVATGSAEWQAEQGNLQGLASRS